MSDFSSYGVQLASQGIVSVPVPDLVHSDPISVELSGIAINQNGDQTGSLPLGTDYLYQTFRLPKDFPLGLSGGETVVVPNLSGVQINVKVAQGYADTAALDWRIDYWSPIQGWLGVVNGTVVGAPEDGDNVWFDIPFKPVDITDYWWRKFRFGISGRIGDPNILQVPIYYDGKQVEIDNKLIDVVPNISPTPLVEGRRYPFQLAGGNPAVIVYQGGDVYYSEQQGVDGVWYTAPNPSAQASSVEYVSVPSEATNVAANLEFDAIQKALPFATVDSSGQDSTTTTIPRIVGSDIKAYANDSVNAVVKSGLETSLRFRIMATAPDADRDCTGSVYRTVAVQNQPESVKTSVGDLQNSYWLSAPNPSQFACEALYFDISNGGDPQVVDHLVIDPTTPGIWMNVYFSSDPLPGKDTESWDALLWQKVDKQYQLRRKETFALPEPITAKYLKLEFTQLQPAWYAPGTFQLPTQYRKHPKWVMDYYLAYYQYVRSQDLEEAAKVNVTFDVLDLAYNYYLDDLRQDFPNAPTTVNGSEGVSLLTDFLQQETTAESSMVDAQTLLQIQTSLQQFNLQPVNQTANGGLLQNIAASSAPSTSNYPVEQTTTPVADLGLVSSLDRDSLIVEKGFPITSFYLTSRHYYLIASAPFDHDRAYFAGIKEVTFTREHYASRFDSDLYIESAGDDLNIESNDFASVDNTWVTYSTTS